MDNLTKEQRHINMSQIRSKNTCPEKIVRRILTKLGYRYRLHLKKLLGKPDIVLSGNGAAIFVNGCFWHQHKDCRRQAVPKVNKEYWIPKLKRNIKRQMENIKQLEKEGWKVKIIWECETKDETSLMKKIKRIL